MARDILSTRTRPLVEGMPADVAIDYKVLPSAKRPNEPYPRRARMRFRPAARGREQVLRFSGRD